MSIETKISLLAFVVTTLALSEATGESLQVAPECGWIGVGVGPVSKVMAESLGMDVPYGAIFDSPEAGSPAASAGIEMGDVLTTVNGNSLERWSDFAGIISSMAPGDTVYLTIRRNEQLLEVAPMVGQGKCP
jgi:serine protease Do